MMEKNILSILIGAVVVILLIIGAHTYKLADTRDKLLVLETKLDSYMNLYSPGVTDSLMKENKQFIEVVKLWNKNQVKFNDERLLFDQITELAFLKADSSAWLSTVRLVQKEIEKRNEAAISTDSIPNN